MAGPGFNFDSRGIGKLLQQGRLQVPPNQRSYAWREKHIRNLFQDLNEAISKGDANAEYFLGTIVLIQKGSETPSIVDGQQRLATTTILLARIRDRFLELNRENSARSIEDSFLRKWTMEEAHLMYRHANERIDALPHDPLWDKYEMSHKADVAQRKEQGPSKPEVAGSIPAAGTTA
jgi:hypothetical protein